MLTLKLVNKSTRGNTNKICAIGTKFWFLKKAESAQNNVNINLNDAFATAYRSRLMK